MVREEGDSVAVKEGVAVAVAVSAYGVSFGALSVAAGLDIWQTCVLSLLMFSGGSQFAFIGVIAAGGAAAGPAAVASAALLGARNGIYAMRLAPVIDGRWWRKGLAAHVTIDESMAVSTAQDRPRAQRVGFWVTGILIFLGWNLTTLVGALIGDAIGDVTRFGLDAAAAAAFLGLLWPRLSTAQPVIVAIAAAVVCAVLTPALPTGVPVLMAAVVAVVVGITNWWGRKAE
ncbi:AzlC family ABC transporter permease [Salinibacterium sp. ZJ450]|uniref:AzlC family ABC transporter permease n=1 Tax=Salinibacterium sp. ZJ450 TaxID=2708338 RepID=UPI00141F70C1